MPNVAVSGPSLTRPDVGAGMGVLVHCYTPSPTELNLSPRTLCALAAHRDVDTARDGCINAFISGRQKGRDFLRQQKS